MFCPKCGKPAVDGAAFCASCGTQLEDRREIPKSRPRKGLAIAAALVGVLALGGAVAFFALNNFQHNEICGEWELAVEHAGDLIRVNFDFDESNEVEVEAGSVLLDGTENWGTCRGTWEYLYEKDGSSCYEITLDRTVNKEVVRSLLGEEAPEVDMKVVVAVPDGKSLTGLWEIKGSFYGSSSEPPSWSEFACSASVGDNMGVSYSCRSLDGYGEEIDSFTMQLHAATPEPGRLVLNDGTSQYSANLSTPWGGR